MHGAKPWDSGDATFAQESFGLWTRIATWRKPGKNRRDPEITAAALHIASFR